MGGKPAQPHQATKHRLLQYRQGLADTIQPADHRGIDRHRHPHALGISELIGHFAEADGGTHVGDEIEGMEEIHIPYVAVGIPSGDQRHAEHRDGIDRNQRDQRRPQSPHEQKGQVIHAFSAVSAPFPPPAE